MYLTRILVPTALVLVGAAGCKVSANGLGSGTPSHPVSADVAITSCQTQGDGHLQAGIAITNHSSRTSDYTYHVDFMKNNIVIAQGSGVENNIAAGHRTDDTVTGTAGKSQRNNTGPVTCHLVNVTRFASS